MQIKLVALDLDGTILRRDGSSSDYTKEVIRKLRTTGTLVVLCTGRRRRTAFKIAQELGLVDLPAVILNGTVVRFLDRGEVIYRIPLEREAYFRAVKLLKEDGVRPIAIADGEEIDLYYDDEGEDDPHHYKYIQRNKDNARRVDDLLKFLPEDTCQVCVIGEYGRLVELMEKIRGDIEPVAQICVVKQTIYRASVLEVYSKRASKWRGICKIAGEQGVAEHEILAIGDDWNDYDMIKNAGFGVAVGGAVDTIKEIADLVLDEDEDSVAKYLDGLLQEGVLCSI